VDRRKVRTYVAPRELFTGVGKSFDQMAHGLRPQITPFVAGSKNSPEDVVYGKASISPEAEKDRRPEINDVEDAEQHWLYGKSFMGRLDGHKYLLLWKAAAQARDRVLQDLDGGQMEMERVPEVPLQPTREQKPEDQASTGKIS
jgi:hypothetical protein